MTKINSLFIGGLFTNELSDKIMAESKSSIQFAANEFQKKFLNSINLTKSFNVRIVSLPFLGHYPFGYTKRKFNYKKKEKLEYDLLEFNNIFGIKNFSRMIVLNKYIKENNYLRDYDLIFVYSAHNPFIKSMQKMLEHNKNTKVIFILPDLPQYMNSTNNVFFKSLKLMDSHSIFKGLSKFDNFIVLTEQMRDFLETKMTQNFLILEGIANSVEIKEDKKNNIIKQLGMSEEKVKLCYTGTLDERYGIKELIHAFSLISNRNYRIYICGAGDSENYIIEESKKDNRIIYLGQKKAEETQLIQLCCDILINPRRNIGEYTKYSFPSKTMEYLSAGKPVICYKLEGIPSEYDEYLNYVDIAKNETNQVEFLASKIQEVATKQIESLVEYSKKVQQFIEDEKSEKATGKKILDFCERIL